MKIEEIEINELAKMFEGSNFGYIQVTMNTLKVPNTNSKDSEDAIEDEMCPLSIIINTDKFKLVSQSNNMVEYKKELWEDNLRISYEKIEYYDNK